METYMKVAFVFFFLFFLTGCQIKTITVPVEGVREDKGIISIQCADIIQPNDSSDVGIPCEAVTTSDTVFEDENGNQITINDISFKDRIKITLENRQNIDGSNPESREFEVERVVLLDE